MAKAKAPKPQKPTWMLHLFEEQYGQQFLFEFKSISQTRVLSKTRKAIDELYEKDGNVFVRPANYYDGTKYKGVVTGELLMCLNDSDDEPFPVMKVRRGYYYDKPTFTGIDDGGKV